MSACLLSLVVATLWPLGWGGKFVHLQYRDMAKVWYFVWPFFLVTGFRQVEERQRHQDREDRDDHAPVTAQEALRGRRSKGLIVFFHHQVLTRFRARVRSVSSAR